MDLVLLHGIQDPVNRHRAIRTPGSLAGHHTPQLGNGLLQPALRGTVPLLEQAKQGRLIGRVDDRLPSSRGVVVSKGTTHSSVGPPASVPLIHQRSHSAMVTRIWHAVNTSGRGFQWNRSAGRASTAPTRNGRYIES